MISRLNVCQFPPRLNKNLLHRTGNLSEADKVLLAKFDKMPVAIVQSIPNALLAWVGANLSPELLAVLNDASGSAKLVMAAPSHLSKQVILDQLNLGSLSNGIPSDVNLLGHDMVRDSKMTMLQLKEKLEQIAKEREQSA